MLFGVAIVHLLRPGLRYRTIRAALMDRLMPYDFMCLESNNMYT